MNIYTTKQAREGIRKLLLKVKLPWYESSFKEYYDNTFESGAAGPSYSFTTKADLETRIKIEDQCFNDALFMTTTVNHIQEILDDLDATEKRIEQLETGIQKAIAKYWGEDANGTASEDAFYAMNILMEVLDNKESKDA